MPGARTQAEGVCSASCQGWDLGNQVCWPWPSAVASEVGAASFVVAAAVASSLVAAAGSSCPFLVEYPYPSAVIKYHQ